MKLTNEDKKIATLIKTATGSVSFQGTVDFVFTLDEYTDDIRSKASELLAAGGELATQAEALAVYILEVAQNNTTSAISDVNETSGVEYLQLLYNTAKISETLDNVNSFAYDILEELVSESEGV